MNITVTTTHKITYQVYACWNEEGGMGSRDFGPECDRIEEAIVQLQLARSSENNTPAAFKTDWFIKCDVQTIIK
jgi:hypothetical protein